MEVFPNFCWIFEVKICLPFCHHVALWTTIIYSNWYFLVTFLSFTYLQQFLLFCSLVRRNPSVICDLLHLLPFHREARLVVQIGQRWENVKVSKSGFHVIDWMEMTDWRFRLRPSILMTSSLLLQCFWSSPTRQASAEPSCCPSAATRPAWHRWST